MLKKGERGAGVLAKVAKDTEVARVGKERSRVKREVKVAARDAARVSYAMAAGDWAPPPNTGRKIKWGKQP